MTQHPYRLALERRDLAALRLTMAEGVEFHSPIIRQPGFEGRESTLELFKVILSAVDKFEVTSEVGDATTHILVVDAMFGRWPATTTHLLRLDHDGLIEEIWITARPLTGSAAIAQAIGSGLIRREVPLPLSVVRSFLAPVVGFAAILEGIGTFLIRRLNRSVQ